MDNRKQEASSPASSPRSPSPERPNGLPGPDSIDSLLGHSRGFRYRYRQIQQEPESGRRQERSASPRRLYIHDVDRNSYQDPQLSERLRLSQIRLAELQQNALELEQWFDHLERERALELRELFQRRASAYEGEIPYEQHQAYASHEPYTQHRDYWRRVSDEYRPFERHQAYGHPQQYRERRASDEYQEAQSQAYGQRYAQAAYEEQQSQAYEDWQQQQTYEQRMYEQELEDELEQQEIEERQVRHARLYSEIREQESMHDRIMQSFLRLQQNRLAVHGHTAEFEEEIQRQNWRAVHEHSFNLVTRNQHRRRQIEQEEASQPSKLRKTVRIGIRKKATKKPVNENFKKTIAWMSHKLSPLVSVTTGQVHPNFPKSIMSYLLLSSDQLDSLAHHYHQSYPPTQESFMYPRAVKPWVATNGLVRGLAVDIDTKRKRFGRFIGLRGCESPVRELSGNEEDRIRDLVEAEWEMAHERAEWEKEQQRREFPT